MTDADNRRLPANSSSKLPFLLGYTAAETGNPKDFARALGIPKSSCGNTFLPEEDSGDEAFDSSPVFEDLFAAELFQLDVPETSSSVFGFLPQATPGLDIQEKTLRYRASDLAGFVEGIASSALPRELVANLITSTNLCLCIESFFRHAYRHVPIVHKASFDVATAVLPLLLSTFVVGAVWSYPRDTYFMALEMVELVERSVFENTLFKKLQDPDIKDLNPRSEGVLPLLQAATMLVSISFTFPKAECRRRFREQRFSELTSVTRSLRLASEKSSDPSIPASLEWSDYVFRETCSR